MNLKRSLILAFALVGLSAASVAGFLTYRATTSHVGQFVAGQNGQQRGRVVGEPQRAGQQLLLQKLRNSSLQASLLGLIGAMVIGGVLAVRLSRPIAQLNQAVKRVGAGERNLELAEDGPEELAALAKTFNQMTRQLSSKEESERRLVADIAHELRTPLTILKGEVMAIRDGVLEASPENFERLIGEIDHLTNLVQDLRLLSLNDAHQLVLHKEKTSLKLLVVEVIDSFAPILSEKNLRMISPKTDVHIEIDLERMRQVLYNLLANAIRHTGPNGAIRAEIIPREDSVLLEVFNQGNPIPEKDLPFLFDRFYRADPSRGRESGGSGLGLAIVKAVVDAHGGSTRAYNNDTGVVFEVLLPTVS